MRMEKEEFPSCEQQQHKQIAILFILQVDNYKKASDKIGGFSVNINEKSV